MNLPVSFRVVTIVKIGNVWDDEFVDAQFCESEPSELIHVEFPEFRSNSFHATSTPIPVMHTPRSISMRNLESQDSFLSLDDGFEDTEFGNAEEKVEVNEFKRKNKKRVKFKYQPDASYIKQKPRSLKHQKSDSIARLKSSSIVSLTSKLFEPDYSMEPLKDDQ